MTSPTDTKPRAIDANDPAVKSALGMNPQHLARLNAFAQGAYPICGGRGLLIVVRGSNPVSLRHQGRRNHFPKPAGLDEKSGETGRVKQNGRQFYSDYDLQGVYERRHDGSYQRLFVGTKMSKEWVAERTEKLGRPPGDPFGGRHAADPHRNVFLHKLNQTVCPNLDLFQHGSNDDFLGPGGRGRRKPEPDEVFLAVEPDGGTWLIPSPEALRKFYAARGVSWNY